MKQSHPPLAELHAHLSSSINPSIYWQIAHDLGFRLPQKDYHTFIEYLMLSPQKKTTLNQYLKDIYHPILNKLSSGTHAVERATYEIISGAYRANNITLIELRYNPMKHNLNAELDLDHIIMASLRGMERALLEYPTLTAGIIFCLDRDFSYEKNKIIVEKAIRYHRRGVVGIDFAGPGNPNFHLKEYKDLVEHTRKQGLHVTTHSGEVKDADDMWDAIEFIRPERIGHGIRAAYDKSLMKKLVEQNIVLEVCPLSNLALQAVENLDEMKFIIRTLVENNVKFCINTDWPEIIENAHLWKQLELLRDEKILSDEEIEQCNKIAFASTFIPGKGLEAYL